MTAAIIWVAVGGALGSVARYWVALLMTRLTGPRFPWGTLLINVVGSGVIAWFGALTAPHGPAPASADARLFVMVGICGGFTTFSSFSLQTLELARGGSARGAAAYAGLSVVLCLLSAWAGLTLGA